MPETTKESSTYVQNPLFPTILTDHRRWPYSERWNTDIASAMFLSSFWNSKKTVETVLDEYASFYFGTEAKTGRELLDLLDDNCRDPKRKQKIRVLSAMLHEMIHFGRYGQFWPALFA